MAWKTPEEREAKLEASNKEIGEFMAREVARLTEIVRVQKLEARTEKFLAAHPKRKS